VKNPHDIIVAPYITEKSVALSYGDDNSALLRKKHELKKAGTAPKKGEKVTVTEEDLVRKYTFLVAKSSNKIEIKQAIEAIYNAGKKKGETIDVQSVRTVRVLGKKRRRGQRSVGYEPDRKKAIITLAKGQILEDYGV
jgi:large subunit ribosomal protein L23